MLRRLKNPWTLHLHVGVLIWLIVLGQPLLAAPDTDQVPLDADYRIGAAHQIDRLIVAPIFRRTDGQVSPFTSLDRALAAGTAIVQEVGADRPSSGPDPDRFLRNVMPDAQPSVPPHEDRPSRQATVRPEPNQVQQIQQMGPSGSARVNTLEIINKGRLPILVLAGTIVKGGRQDRQIGQDFVIEPGKRVPVDAFCVEKGRWNASRQGKETAGKFEAAPILANQAVRAAGQYEQSQTMVWDRVSALNKAAGTETPSDTLSATLDDARLVKARTELAHRITTCLNGLRDRHRLVGLAYGIDGRPRAVRWFASPALFGFFRETLVNTAAFDAVTASLQPSSPTPVRMTPADVAAFVSGIRSTPQTDRRQTEAGNTNVVWRAEGGYGSETLRVSNGKQVVITADVLAK